ncbi:MAG: hypothetical protein ACK5AZ_12270 [Bryobacteraceae bacterium]
MILAAAVVLPLAALFAMMRGSGGVRIGTPMMLLLVLAYFLAGGLGELEPERAWIRSNAYLLILAAAAVAVLNIQFSVRNTAVSYSIAIGAVFVSAVASLVLAGPLAGSMADRSGVGRQLASDSVQVEFDEERMVPVVRFRLSGRLDRERRRDSASDWTAVDAR